MDLFFNGWGSTASRLQLLREGSLLFTTQFPEIPGTHFIDSEGWKAESTSEPPSGFEHATPGLRIQRLNHWAIAPYKLDYTQKSCRSRLFAILHVTLTEETFVKEGFAVRFSQTTKFLHFDGIKFCEYPSSVVLALVYG